MKKLLVLSCGLILVGCAATSTTVETKSSVAETTTSFAKNEDRVKENFKFKPFAIDPTGKSRDVAFTKHEGDDKIMYKTKPYQTTGNVSRPVPYNELYLTEKEVMDAQRVASSVVGLIKEENVLILNKYMKIPYTSIVKEDKRSDGSVTYELEFAVGDKKVSLYARSRQDDPAYLSIADTFKSKMERLNSSVIDKDLREGLWTFSNTPGVQLVVWMDSYKPSASFESNLAVDYTYFLEDGTVSSLGISGPMSVATSYFQVYNALNGVDPSKQDSTQFTNYHKQEVPFLNGN